MAINDDFGVILGSSITPSTGCDDVGGPRGEQQSLLRQALPVLDPLCS